jgi:G3E family GTPase
MARVPVHIVTGFLGAGKTTLLIDQLARRQGEERCAVVVNDFGQARIDASLLDGAVAVTEIPGGCVCCTAPEGLVPAVEALVEQGSVDRIFLEATGLARPADIVDTLTRSPLSSRIEVAPVVVVVDPGRLAGDPPPLLLEQVDAADVLVASHVERATEETLAGLDQLAEGHFPPWLASVRAQEGAVDVGLFDLRRSELVFRKRSRPSAPSTEGFGAASRLWTPDRVFELDALRAVLEDCGAERAKGLFRTEAGWMLLELAAGQVRHRPSQIRSASAVDVIVEGSVSQAEDIVQQLEDAVYVEVSRQGVHLSDGHGYEVQLTRFALAALPGQIDDVSTLFPKRRGRGVRLSEVLGLTLAADHAHFVVAASDGMTTEPVLVGAAGDAILVHSLDDGPLPDKLGGPCRLLVPEGSACASVKGVARIRVLS